MLDCNRTFQKKVNVTETFKAQAKSQMEFNEAPNGQITSSPNKKLTALLILPNR